MSCKYAEFFGSVYLGGVFTVLAVMFVWWLCTGKKRPDATAFSDQNERW